MAGPKEPKPKQPGEPEGDAGTKKKTKPPAQDDEVTEASKESFPASDPPSWTPLHTG